MIRIQYFRRCISHANKVDSPVNRTLCQRGCRWTFRQRHRVQQIHYNRADLFDNIDGNRVWIRFHGPIRATQVERCVVSRQHWILQTLVDNMHFEWVEWCLIFVAIVYWLRSLYIAWFLAIKEADEEEVTLRRKHRRQSSLGVSIKSDGQESRRRRSSYTSTSWVRDADDEADADELSTRTGRSRPGSWGPIGEFFYRDSLSFCDSERSPMSHHECNLKKEMRNPVAPTKIRFNATVNERHAAVFEKNLLAKLETFFWVHSLFLLKLSHSTLAVYIASNWCRQSKTV